MPAPTDWIEHRRGDRELLGWMLPDGDGFVAIDLLGRAVTGSVDWLAAEEAIESTGIGYLAEPFELLLDDSGADGAPSEGSGHWVRVRVVEVSTDRVLVKKEDWGDVTATAVYYSAPFPVADRLRPFAGDVHVLPAASDSTDRPTIER
ncbi:MULTISPECIES: hypothetical protein [unclassified Leifsonia]|uniref:hypothetical protein n=1 Tax=unclassified Leifsonia TaxID=2663824 RepID=UPI0006FD494A|nr:MULTISPECIES: hypothetical protein [unclassified Leifsonia]KQX06496.1 hypothetical protein ASC59_01105 [Leifsonia sp. Root1293]KRA10779.1 hypothetical protein ASD61_01105 [Leifsonia sp. Root60]